MTNQIITWESPEITKLTFHDWLFRVPGRDLGSPSENGFTEPNAVRCGNNWTPSHWQYDRMSRVGFMPHVFFLVNHRGTDIKRNNKKNAKIIHNYIARVSFLSTMPTHKYVSQIGNHPQVSKAKISKNIGNQHKPTPREQGNILARYFMWHWVCVAPLGIPMIYVHLQCHKQVDYLNL